MTIKLYWCSWRQPTVDYRPIKFPPNEQILGWWCSGHNGDGSASLCAWVKAESETEVLAAVTKDWPEITSMDQFRFCEPKEFYEPSDRFPTESNEWIQKRIEPFLKS